MVSSGSSSNIKIPADGINYIEQPAKPVKLGEGQIPMISPALGKKNTLTITGAAPMLFKYDQLKGRISKLSNLVMAEILTVNLDPDYRDGDLTLIDLGQTSPEDGGVFAIALRQAIAFRRVLPLKDGQFRIYSKDPDKEAAIMIDDDKVKILGRIVGIWRTA